MSENVTATPKPSEKPVAKKPPSKRPSSSDGECLAASFFALKLGSVASAKKALQELDAEHAATIKFVVECGGIEDALERLDDLGGRLVA